MGNFFGHGGVSRSPWQEAFIRVFAISLDILSSSEITAANTKASKSHKVLFELLHNQTWLVF
jgi:hypothetical protein